jgi:hypothetical protein
MTPIREGRRSSHDGRTYVLDHLDRRRSGRRGGGATPHHIKHRQQRVLLILLHAALRSVARAQGKLDGTQLRLGVGEGRGCVVLTLLKPRQIVRGDRLRRGVRSSLERFHRFRKLRGRRTGIPARCHGEWRPVRFAAAVLGGALHHVHVAHAARGRRRVNPTGALAIESGRVMRRGEQER